MNIISSAAFDNRTSNKDSYHIMEQRIAKIIRLAAKDILICQGKSALILGAFGCGVLKNDPSEIATIFAHVLNDEKIKEYFDCIIFSMNNEQNNQDVFRSKLLI